MSKIILPAAACAATAVLVAVLALYLTANGSALQRRACGWQSNIPPNGTRICRLTYVDLNRIARAEVSGDWPAIRRYVVSDSVARRLVAYGQTLARLHARFLHVAPDPDLTALHDGEVQVSLYLVGADSAGKIDEADQITERVRRNAVGVVSDSGFVGQSW